MSGWKWLVIVLAVLAAGFLGYRFGHHVADSERLAEINKLKADYASAEASAQKQARLKVSAEVTRANEAEKGLLEARRTIAVQRREISNRRIEDASHVEFVSGRCAVGPEWVHLYNEAIGLGSAREPVPASASGAAGEAGAAPAPDSGVFSGWDVTPEDVLAHVRDYGGRCRDIEAQLNALINWAEER